MHIVEGTENADGFDDNETGAGNDGDAVENGDNTEVEGEGEGTGEGEAAAATKQKDEDNDAENLRLRLAKALAQRDSERAAVAERDRAIEQLRAKVEPPKDEGPSELEQLNAKAEALYEQVEEARADADVKTAARLQRELDKINRTIAVAEASSAATTDISAKAVANQFNRMADYIEQSVEELNPKSEMYDEGKAALMNELVEAYEAAGKSSTDALLKASIVVLGRNVFGAEASAAKPKPAGKPAVTNKPPDLRKAIDAASRQPARGSAAVADNSDLPNVPQMTDEEFAALPEKTRAKLRGDYV